MSASWARRLRYRRWQPASGSALDRAMACSFQRVGVILPVQCPIVLILSDTGGTMETCAPTPNGRAPGAEQLRRFRTGFYRCLTGWADAAFELCDAALCAPAPIGSVPTLSLEPAFRRSQGSLYKALARGDVDADAMC